MLVSEESHRDRNLISAWEIFFACCPIVTGDIARNKQLRRAATIKVESLSASKFGAQQCLLNLFKGSSKHSQRYPDKEQALLRVDAHD